MYSKSARGFNGCGDMFELPEAALLDSEADCRALLCIAVLQSVNERQGRLALREIVTEVLATLLRAAAVVQQIVYELKCRADASSIFQQCPAVESLAPASTAAISAPASKSLAVLR